MNALRSFTVTLLISLSCTQLVCMHQPRTLEKILVKLQKALSQNKQKHSNYAQRILKNNPELVTAYFRGRPIAHAAQTAAAVKLLASHRADFNQEDRFGNSALHNAKNSATTLALLIAGMEINKPNADGQTALFFAHSARQVEVLIQFGADVNALDNFGRSALYYARSGGVAKALIQAGANLDIEDENGRTPGQVLIHTNPEAARHVEFFLKRQAEKKEIRQKKASKKPTMVWRAKPKPVVAVETEQKVSKFDALVIPALIIEQLEAEAMREEAEIQEAKLTEQIIQNSTPIVSQAQIPTDPLAHFIQENHFAVLLDDTNEDTPAPQPTTIKEQTNPAHTLDHFAQPNHFAALMLNDDTSVIQQPPAPISAPKHKHKPKKHVAFTTPIITNQPTITTTNSATPLPEEEHIEYVPQVHTTIRHVTPADIPNSTPVIAPQPTMTEIKNSEPVTIVRVPTVQNISTVPNHNATAQEYFNPFANTNYYSALEVETPDSSHEWDEWIDIMTGSKI